MPDEAFFSLAPDWVCAVLSPSTERFDRRRKRRIYAEAGVAHAWLMKPQDRTLEVLRLREGVWTILAVWEDAAAVRAEPFEAVELELRRRGRITRTLLRRECERAPRSARHPGRGSSGRPGGNTYKP